MHVSLSPGHAPSAAQKIDDSRKGSAGQAPAAPVSILLCTRNGASFLLEQLASLARQSYPHWRIIVSDDGSTDATRALLGSLCENHHSVEIRDGPQQGATANFLSLVTDARIAGTFFAYCDQDDVWFPDKLERAVGWLSSVPADVPALYCSRTLLIDAAGQCIGRSPLFTRPADFRNALVQSLAGANTMVFNAAARALLIAAGPCDAVAHDWWTYMLVSGSGGLVYYDPTPSVAYRQHKTNQIGSNIGVSAAAWRLVMFLRGTWTNWNDRNAAALARCAFLLTAANRDALAEFHVVRRGSLVQRLRAWRRLGLYRQTLTGQLALAYAIIFRKI